MRSSLSKEVEGERKRQNQQREKQGLVPQCLLLVRPCPAWKDNSPEHSCRVSNVLWARQGKKCIWGEETQLFYFWILHHQSQSWSELCFLTIRNQKWHEEGKKQAWHLTRPIPVAGSGPRCQHFSFPLWVEEVLWWQNSLKQRRLQWLEMSLSLKYPTGFQTGGWLRGCQPEARGPDVAPWGEVVPCSLSIGWDPTTKASASSRCGQKGTFQRPWLSKQTWLKQQYPWGEKQGGLYKKAGPSALGERTMGLIKEMGGRKREG